MMKAKGLKVLVFKLCFQEALCFSETSQTFFDDDMNNGRQEQPKDGLTISEEPGTFSAQ